MFGYVIQPTHFSIRFLYCFPIDNRRHTYIHTKNNGLSGSNSDVVIANENSFDLAFIYPLKCWGKKERKKKKKISSKHGTARLSARLSARKRALCKCCACRTAQRRPVSNGSGAARQAVQFNGVLDHKN